MVGLALRALRRARLMSQRDLAARAGVAEATIVRLESGGARPNFKTLRKLATALDVAPEELVGDEKPRRDPSRAAKEAANEAPVGEQVQKLVRDQLAVSPDAEPDELVRRTVAMVLGNPSLQRALLEATVESAIVRQLQDAGYEIGADGTATLPQILRQRPRPDEGDSDTSARSW